VIARGLKVGERIVTSDLISATKGMLVIPREDKKSMQRMVLEATGKESEK